MTHLADLARKQTWIVLLIVLNLAAAVWAASLSEYFLDPINLANAAAPFAIFVLMGYALVPIVIQGDIDISLPSTLAVGSVLLANLSSAGVPYPVGVLVTLVACGLCGTLNGVLVAICGLPSLAVTLGTMAAYRGLAYIQAGDSGVSVTDQSYVVLGERFVGILPVLTLLIPLCGIAAWMLLSRTTFGRACYAIGNAPEAARMAGVPVVRTRLLAYTGAGAVAGLGGVVWVAQNQSAQGDNADGTLLLVLTAVVLGGVSIRGGSGSPWGVLLALALLFTVQTGMQLALVPGITQTAVIGVLLVLSVGLPGVLGPLRAALRRTPRSRAPRSATPDDQSLSTTNPTSPHPQGEK